MEGVATGNHPLKVSKNSTLSRLQRRSPWEPLTGHLPMHGRQPGGELGPLQLSCPASCLPASWPLGPRSALNIRVQTAKQVHFKAPSVQRGILLWEPLQSKDPGFGADAPRLYPYKQVTRGMSVPG